MSAREGKAAKAVARPQTARLTSLSQPVINEPMRAAKAVARAGLCSRREAERWIEAGRIALNGKILTTPAVTVSPNDKLCVDGREIKSRLAVKLWRYHKPRGFLTTRSDPENRPTIFQNFPGKLTNVLTVGRLDFNTEGLLLLTNHGGLARHLELPATAMLRRYRVRARGQTDQDTLDRLKDGTIIDGVRYAGAEAVLERQQGQNAWITITLREGKNREIRNLMISIDLEVNRLIRTQYGPFELGHLKPGEIEELSTAAIQDVLPADLSVDVNSTAKNPTHSPRSGRGSKPRRKQPQRPSGKSGKKTAAPTKSRPSKL